jgi:chromatin remodeling complex protein RSC6
MDDLEEMMMMEAIRLSLAAEEERKKKSEKEAAKEAKKRAKAEKKKEKMEKKGVYGSGASSASGSALSLSLPGLGRRRGNSTASSLAREVTPENAETPGSKGKAVDRGVVGAPATSAPIDFARAGSSTVQHGIPGARQLDRGAPANTQESHQPLSSPTAPDRPSHLRQMSNASSPASSFNESIPSSLRNDPHPRGSSSTLDTQNSPNGNTVGNRSSVHEGGDSNGSAGSEPMFNFQSLAAMIGNEDGDKADATKHIEHGESGETPVMGAQEENSTSGLEDSTATLRVDGSNTMRIVPPDVGADRQTTMPWTPQSTAAPELVITPGTPAAMSHREEDAKQLGARGNAESTREIEQ